MCSYFKVMQLVGSSAGAVCITEWARIPVYTTAGGKKQQAQKRPRRAFLVRVNPYFYAEPGDPKMPKLSETPNEYRSRAL